MERKNLILYKTEGGYRTVLKTRHGRVLFLKIINDVIDACYYIDRREKPIPKKLKTLNLAKNSLKSVLETELDSKVYSQAFSEDYITLDDEEFISKMNERSKYNFLIIVKDGQTLETVIKNKCHRVIYIRIVLNESSATIEDCYYCDRQYKKKDKVVPENLYTVSFSHSRENIIGLFNSELNNAFTDVIFITDNSIEINCKRPLCGSI